MTMLSRFSSVALPLALGLMLSGCAMLFPAAPPDTFDLTAPADVTKSKGRGAMLLVGDPNAIQAVDSERIVARTSAGQVTYVPKAQWSDKLPALLQARLTQTFENSGRLAAVGRTSDRLNGQYQLITDIRAFEVADGAPPQAVVEIAAKIVGDSSGRIVAGKVFSARVPVSAVTGPDASRGLDQALGQVLRDLVMWANSQV